jgi:hypothetical protein
VVPPGCGRPTDLKAARFFADIKIMTHRQIGVNEGRDDKAPQIQRI